MLDLEKCSKLNKRCASVAHYGNELSCLACMALYGLDVAFHGHDYVWPHLN